MTGLLFNLALYYVSYNIKYNVIKYPTINFIISYNNKNK